MLTERCTNLLAVQPDIPAPAFNWRAALARLEGAYSPRTLVEYAGDFMTFQHWCEGSGRAPLPAAASDLVQFVEAQMVVCAPRTVMRRLAVIRKIHGLLGLTDLSRDEGVKLAIRRGLRLKGRRPRQALGLSASLRDQLLNACPNSIKGLRDRALIAVGYDTLCRRSELAALRLEDVAPLADGACKVLIRRSKTDPYGQGGFGYISAEAATHLGAWLKTAQIREGPLFRAIFKSAVGQKAIHPRTVNRVLEACALQAGCDRSTVARLTAHSLRVGPAQDLAIAGRTVLQIMRAGRWRHADAVSRYVQAADVNVWALPKP